MSGFLSTIYNTLHLNLHFILVIETYQKSYIPGKLRTGLFFILKIAIFLVNLTDFNTLPQRY